MFSPDITTENAEQLSISIASFKYKCCSKGI